MIGHEKTADNNKKYTPDIWFHWNCDRYSSNLMEIVDGNELLWPCGLQWKESQTEKSKMFVKFSV